MAEVIFLILFPLIIAFAFPIVRRAGLCNILVVLGAIGLTIGSLALLAMNFHHEIVFFKAESVFVDKAMLAVEILIAGYIILQALRFKRPAAFGLTLVQAGLTLWFEFASGARLSAASNIFIDKLSIIMTVVIGIVGSLICVYAIGYMRDFHKEFHRELSDTRWFFFFVMFVFLSAMFGIVFSNNLLWFCFFWEITTVCSFLLIGYKKTPEATGNAFLALEYNLFGGVLLILAIIYSYYAAGSIELDGLMTGNKAVVLLPIVLISCAGLIKSAQLPFSSWLLGAMVAPTPVSALLHSSTMVKAGVYIILRFSSELEGTLAGFVLALIGGLTFLITSCIAVTQSDAKKILAYSTIANLGLIVVCAGVGTYEALWAAALLIIFHAVAKCLLFLCVGVIEHRIHSRNIEEMSSLITSMPKLSIMMQIGMAGMFLAPFGMLISKWAVLKALVDFNPLLAVFVVFGSAVSLFFWVKWMGTLISVVEEKESLEDDVTRSEWTALLALSIITIGVCGFFPAVSSILIAPYVIEICGKTAVMSQGNIMIMSIMLGMVMLFPLSFINYGKRVKVVDAYLGGANIDTHTKFRGAKDAVINMQMKNYYLVRYFGEGRLFKYGVIACAVLTLIMVAVSKL